MRDQYLMEILCMRKNRGGSIAKADVVILGSDSCQMGSHKTNLSFSKGRTLIVLILKVFFAENAHV